MANEFVAKNGLISQNNSTVSGSLTVNVAGSNELTVAGTGVTIGSAATDTHRVTGSLSIQGLTSQTPFQVLSGSTSLLFVSRSGNIGIGNNLTMLNFTNINSGGNSIGFETFRTNFSTTFNTINNQYGFNFGDGGGSNTNTSGVTGRFQLSSRFSPTSGTSVYNTFYLNPSVNQTGGANGITRGLFIDPTLTSAADFRAIQINSGSLVMADSYLASGSRSGSLLDLSQTWNTAGNVDAIKLTVTGTGGASSNLINLLVGTTSRFKVDTSGNLEVGGNRIQNAGNNSSIVLGNAAITSTVSVVGSALSRYIFAISAGNAATTGTENMIISSPVYTPSSGTAIFNGFVYSPTINQTGGANGIARGLFINPTLTSAPNFRGIEIRMVPVSAGSNSCVGILVSGSNTRGGAGYIDFLQATNTSASIANPNKFFRLSTTGDLEIVNSNYATVILSLTDAGVFSTPGGGTSDARVKNTITYITSSAYDIISQLKPASFEFNNTPGITRHGFIAQDVIPIKPDLVLGDGDKKEGIYGLDYDGILALTVKALQEANSRIDTLEQQIGVLKNK